MNYNCICMLISLLKFEQISWYLIILAPEKGSAVPT